MKEELNVERLHLQQEILAANLDFSRRLLSLSFVVMFATLASVAFLSRAWFANNRDVNANGNSVQASSMTSSLFIARGEVLPENDHKNIASSVIEPDQGLYPISTLDCKNWFYASEWREEESADGESAQIVACDYTKADISVSENGIVWEYEELDGNSRVAFYKEAFILYTDKEEIDVYLDSDDPITVRCGTSVTESDQAEADKILAALRVAIVNSDGDILIYYAPINEVGKGNSTGAIENKYYAVAKTGENNSIQEISDVIVPENIGNYAASIDGGNYSVGEKSVKLGTATKDGIILHVFIWLEGTDAQALQHLSAGITTPLNVNCSYIGLE